MPGLPVRSRRGPALAGSPGRIHSAREWAKEESLTIAIAAYHCIACLGPL
jgi:hypothetical protein